MVSLYSLSQPRHPRTKHKKSYGVPSSVSDRVKNYVVTERIANLAKPKHPKDDSEEPYDPFKVDYNAKHFQTSKIISVELRSHFSFSILLLYQLSV